MSRQRNSIFVQNYIQREFQLPAELIFFLTQYSIHFNCDISSKRSYITSDNVFTFPVFFLLECSYPVVQQT